MIPRGAPVVLAALLAASCATAPAPPGPSPLPEVRLKEVGELVSGGSFLQGLQEISWLRRESQASVSVVDLDDLEARALSALATALQKAVSEKNYEDAVRYLRSAAALGRVDLAGSWSEKSLLAAQVSSLEESGDTVAALAVRLRTLALGEPSEAELDAALSAAVEAGNRPVVRWVAGRLKSLGVPVPPGSAAAISAAEETPSFTEMLGGAVMILVNRGIKIEKGVGYPDRVIGSGFFIDRRGYLLTNYHVIKSEVDPKYEGYSRLFVKLSESAAGERIPAKVVGYDPVLDLALIKAEVAGTYTFAGFGGEAAAPGDRIYAIGSPAGLEKTITSGIVSAVGRRLQQVGDTIQVDVPLNPGNSGGPLLNEKGDLIGIVFAGLEQFQGLNFAIPYAWVEKALPLLFKGGEAVHPWLGLALSETDKGLEVVYVLPGEPAANAGIRTGDIIESLDGTRFTDLGSIQEAVLRHTAPCLVRLSYRRGEATVDALLCLSARPQSPVETALKRDIRDNVLYPLFGMELKKVGSFLWKDDYVVQRVTQGSVADESGLSENDPLTIQDWKVDDEKGYATLQIVIKKRKAGFIESAIQIASYLDTDNFI